MLVDFNAFVRKFSLFIAACFLFFGFSTNANAALIGQSVFGELNFSGGATNLFDSANVTNNPLQGALNEANPGASVTIADPGFEFAYVVNGDTGIFANFTDNGLFVNHDVVATPVGTWTMSFQSSAFTGLILAELLDGFPSGGVSAALAGDTITLEWAGPSSITNYQANYSLQAVPLPAALPLFASGLAAMGLIGWRRKRKFRAAV